MPNQNFAPGFLKFGFQALSGIEAGARLRPPIVLVLAQSPPASQSQHCPSTVQPKPQHKAALRKTCKNLGGRNRWARGRNRCLSFIDVWYPWYLLLRVVPVAPLHDVLLLSPPLRRLVCCPFSQGGIARDLYFFLGGRKTDWSQNGGGRLTMAALYDSDNDGR